MVNLWFQLGKWSCIKMDGRMLYIPSCVAEAEIANKILLCVDTGSQESQQTCWEG